MPNFIFLCVLVYWKSIYSLLLFLAYSMFTVWFIKAHKPSNKTIDNINYLIHLTCNCNDIITDGKLYPTIGIGNYSKIGSNNIFGFSEKPTIYQYPIYKYNSAIKIKLTKELKEHIYIRYLDNALILSVTDLGTSYLDITNLEYEIIEIA